MSLENILLIAIVVAIILVLGRFLLSLLSWVVLIVAGIVAFIFVGDTATGGTSLKELGERISIWIRSKTGG